MSNTTKWYIIFLLNLLLFFMSISFGFLKEVWFADVTKISFIILIIFFIASLKCGFSIYKFEKSGEIHPRDIEFGWFTSEKLLGLGMAGTVIGFIIIMKDFAGVDVTNSSSIEALIKSLGSGISTALYTTLFGLIGNLSLKLQYFLLEDCVEKSK